MESSDFSALLVRLADQRGLDLHDLARQAGLTRAELKSALREPSPVLLRQLAPAFDLHAEDLFAAAYISLPDELAPLDAAAGQAIPQLVDHAMRLSPELRERLRQDIRSLPSHSHAERTEVPRAHEQYAPGPGAVLMRMLASRNLSWSSSVKVLSRLAGVHLAASTIGTIGHGGKDLTPDLLSAFAILLGVNVDDLAALLAIDRLDSTPAEDPIAADIAGLIWDVRRLSGDQVRQVCGEAETLLGQG